MNRFKVMDFRIVISENKKKNKKTAMYDFKYTITNSNLFIREVGYTETESGAAYKILLFLSKWTKQEDEAALTVVTVSKVSPTSSGVHTAVGVGVFGDEE